MTRQRAASSPAVVPARPQDTEMLSQLIAGAFEPLDVCQWLIPDRAARRAILPAYFRMYVEHAFAGGLVHTTPDRAGAALWIPASGPAGLADGYAGQLAQVTGPWVHRFQVFDAALGAHHLTGVEHHHLAILAVTPTRQGRGIGTALLVAHNGALDQLGLTAYLEASSQRTRGIYLRHGYTDHGGPIQLPDGPRMYPMTRQPRPALPARAGRLATATATRTDSTRRKIAMNIVTSSGTGSDDADGVEPRRWVRLMTGLRGQVTDGTLAPRNPAAVHPRPGP
jgi:GNAT superfamily N-acetyltransferase